MMYGSCVLNPLDVWRPGCSAVSLTNTANWKVGVRLPLILHYLRVPVVHLSFLILCLIPVLPLQ